MAYEYMKRARGKTGGAHTGDAPPQPDTDVLRAGKAQTAAAQPGRRVDLPEAMRKKMENAFGADLSAVKLYESEAVGDAGARAVAQGADIAFAPGLLDFTSFGGQALLGHELSHVVSQARGEAAGRGFLDDPALEARADREGAMAAAGETVAPPTAALSPIAAAPAAGPMQASKDEQKKKAKLGRQAGKKDAAVKDMVERFDAKEADMTAAMKAQGFSDEEIEAQKMFQRVNDSHGMRDRLASVQGDGADGNAEGSLAFRLGRGVFSKKGAAKRAARESRLTGEILAGDSERQQADRMAADLAYQNQQPDRDEAALQRAQQLARSAEADDSGSFLAGQQRIGAEHNVAERAKAYQASLGDTRRWGYRLKREEDIARGTTQGVIDESRRKEAAALQGETASMQSASFSGTIRGGVMNQVYRFNEGGGKAAKGGYFKPKTEDFDFKNPLLKMVGIDTGDKSAEPNMANREIAFSVLGKLLGSTVALESRQAEVADSDLKGRHFMDDEKDREYKLGKGDAGVLMEEAQGSDWDHYNWEYFGPETFMGSDEAMERGKVKPDKLSDEEKKKWQREEAVVRAIRSGEDQSQGATIGERLAAAAPGVKMAKKSTASFGAKTLASKRKEDEKRFTKETLDASDANFQREMNELFLLDTLAGHPDRHGGNFRVDHRKDGSIGVKSIDNDLTFGENMDYFGKKTDHYGGLPEQMQIDRKMAESIRGMSKETLETSMGHLLKREEIDTLWEKFGRLREYIDEMEKKGLLVDKWDENTAKREFELAGGLGSFNLADQGKKKYSGTTYYQKMLLDLNGADRAFSVHKWDY